MARIRTIKPEFWTSEQIAECSPNARLLFIGMWNFCDDGGNKPASAKSLKMQVFPGDNFTVSEIEGMVAELIHNGLVAEYTAKDGITYWHITGWHHQKIDRPSFKYPKFDEHSTSIRRAPPPGREGNGKEGNIDADNARAREEEKNFKKIHRDQVSEWVEELAQDEYTRECFTRSRKIPQKKYSEYFAAFKTEAKARTGEYSRIGDVTQHFLNFSARRYEAEQRAKSGPKKGSATGRATINNIGGEGTDYTAEQAF